MIKFSEMMFYAENEGLLPTRQGKINAIIKDVKNYPAASIDEDDFIQIVNKHGLTYKSLTQKELNYISFKISH